MTLQPLERFALDAAILFSDILTIPDAMGLGLYFAEGEGPKFERTVRTEEDVRKLGLADLDSLKYVFDAVSLIRKSLDGRVPLIGFSGSPFTLACYMVEGGGSDDFRLVKSMLYARPDLLHRILDLNAQSVTAYLNAQIAAGAQAVMVFDTWGGALSDAAYREFSLAYATKVFDGRDAHRRGPRRAAHPLHQGRRAVARVDGGGRRGRAGPRLDHRHRRGAPARGRPGRAAGQHGSDGALRLAGGHRARGEAHPGELRTGVRGTSSTSATAFPSSPRRTTSRRSSRRSTATPSGPPRPDPCQAENFRGSDCLFTCCVFSRPISAATMAPQHSVVKYHFIQYVAESFSPAG